MEAQAKALADLITAISSMNAMIDDMHPIVLELNQRRPGVDCTVDALRAQVGDLRARVDDAAHPAEPAVATDMPPLLLLSTDVPSSSTKSASASKHTSAAAATSCIDVCTRASPLDTNGCIAEVPAQACSSPDQDAFATSMGVTTVDMLWEGVPESVPMSATLQGSLSSVSISNEALGVDPSACTGFITMAPTTCSMIFLRQDPVAAPVLVASLPLTMTESSASQRATTWFPVHRPVPWSSFLAVHANGGETRPLPWPSFKISYSRESPSDAALKPSRRCTSDCSPSTTIGDVIEFHGSSYYGNLRTSTSCITIHDMCSASELRCWHGVLLFLEYLGYASEYVQSVGTLHITLVWSSCPIFGFPMRVIVRSLERKLLSHDSVLVTLPTVILDSGNGVALSCECLGVDITDCVDSWLFPGSVAVCQESSVHSSFDYIVARETISGVLSTTDWHLVDFPCISAVTVCLSYPQELDHYFSSSQLKKLQILNLRRRLDVSYDPFENQCTSCFPGYFSWVFCHRHQFLFGFSPSFHPVVMLELQLARTGSHSGYVQKLQVDRRGIEGATLNSNSINMNRCRPMCYVSSLAYSVRAVYCSSFSCTCTICESILAPTIFSSAWANLLWFFNSEMCALQVGLLILNGARIKSEMSNRDISTHATKGFLVVYAPIQTGRIPPSICAGSYSHKKGLYMPARGLLFFHNQEGVHSLVDSDSRMFARHAWLSGFVLLCLLEKQLLPTWPPLIASCPITNSMFRNDELPSLVICELWLQNHQDMRQMQFVWQPSAHACFITIERSYENNESHCRLYWYHGGPAVFSLLAFGRQGVFQGGRCAMTSIPRYLALNYIDYLDSLSSNGLKVLQFPWDPGVCNVSLSAGLRASRMLRRGECHVPTITWAGRWAGPVATTHTKGEPTLPSWCWNSQDYIGEEATHGRDREELEPGRRTLARADGLFL